MKQRVSSYKRQLRSVLAEQILAKCNIFVNIDKLRPYIIGNMVDKSSDLYKVIKNASQNSSYISTEYDSIQKRTARLFTKKNHLNLITLNDKRILSSIKSRYEDGFILVLDYQNFEPSIIKGYYGDDTFPEDLHTWASELLEVDRSVAKKYNMLFLYGDNLDRNVYSASKELLNTHECSISNILLYVEQIILIRFNIDSLIEPMVKTYENQGFILNTYGRKIYPTRVANIFNNVIQSIGSEILIEAIIKLNEYIDGKNIQILFHRFDSIYFDVMKSKIVFKQLNKVVKIMESIDNSVQLKVNIQLGKTLASLKEIDSG